MQELRLVLIIIGGLAIAALLVHGLWTSKREGKAKFGDKPFGKIDMDSAAEPHGSHHDSDDDYQVVSKSSYSKDFAADIMPADLDPLIDNPTQPFEPAASAQEQAQPLTNVAPDDDPIPSFSAIDDEEIEAVSQVSLANAASMTQETVTQEAASQETVSQATAFQDTVESEVAPVVNSAPQPSVEQVKETPVSDEQSEPEDELEVIVLNVHTANDQAPFVGTKLFDSMQQNGLLYGEMDIFHRHADLSGTGRVLFSVANMMQPGTLKHDDPAQFSTKGISFFMTLPCFGDAEQNFKLMLKTAQQIADDLGGEVQDDSRKLMTPMRLDHYRKQIQAFKARKTA
ncbi:cell division protein ZipA [Vibrio sp. WXL103]|uniref:cell division protein ZipA n=1 Tax=unclassified Vibrio TaxID=2614977 RepID=UPI003EC6751D